MLQARITAKECSRSAQEPTVFSCLVGKGKLTRPSTRLRLPTLLALEPANSGTPVIPFFVISSYHQSIEPEFHRLRSSPPVLCVASNTHLLPTSRATGYCTTVRIIAWALVPLRLHQPNSPSFPSNARFPCIGCFLKQVALTTFQTLPFSPHSIRRPYAQSIGRCCHTQLAEETHGKRFAPQALLKCASPGAVSFGPCCNLLTFLRFCALYHHQPCQISVQCIETTKRNLATNVSLTQTQFRFLYVDTRTEQSNSFD